MAKSLQVRQKYLYIRFYQIIFVLRFMKETTQYLLVFLMMVLSFKSEAQVAVNLFPSPADQFFIDDLWKTTIVNAGTSNVNVSVQFQIKDNSQSTVLTVTTQAITLSPGLNRLSTSEGLSGKWAYGNQQASSILQQTGRLPFGAYVFCVTVNEISTNKNIGSNCDERNIKPMSPPILSNPYD